MLRLKWKGMEVSEELQRYAARVARGEQLEPYRGPILPDTSATLRLNGCASRARRAHARKLARAAGWLLGCAALMVALSLIFATAPDASHGKPFTAQESPLLPSTEPQAHGADARGSEDVSQTVPRTIGGRAVESKARPAASRAKATATVSLRAAPRRTLAPVTSSAVVTPSPGPTLAPPSGSESSDAAAAAKETGDTTAAPTVQPTPIVRQDTTRLDTTQLSALLVETPSF